MWTTRELHNYIIQSYVEFYIFKETMNVVSIKMYFIAMHYIDRGEY